MIFHLLLATDTHQPGSAADIHQSSLVTTLPSTSSAAGDQPESSSAISEAFLL